MHDPSPRSRGLRPDRRDRDHAGAGALGDPWLFAQLLGRGHGRADRDEILDELALGDRTGGGAPRAKRAARYLQKFHPWYVDRLGTDRTLNDALQPRASLDAARAVLGTLRTPVAAAV